MEQLSLGLTPKLIYSPQAFMLHSGAVHLHARALNEILQKRFSIICINGGPRTGKTHFSIRLALDASLRGCYPILIDGDRLHEEIAALSGRSPVDHTTLFIVDDFDKFFLRPDFSDSGAFVHFVESLRSANASLVVLSGRSLRELPADEHVMSRLIPGEGYVLGPPEEEEVLDLLLVMAKQRGIVLKERKRKYLLRRLGFDAASIERFLDRLLQISTGQERTLRYSFLKDAL